MKMQDVLENWGGITLNVVTDEDIQDINLAIKYHDHGDEFLYVRTNSGEEYEYGYWLNRKNCFSDFDINKNSGESDRLFLKRPILFSVPDKHSEVSNSIFREIHSNGLQEWMDFGPRKYDSDIARLRFERVIKRIKIYLSNANTQGIMYHQDDTKKYLLTFIELNGLGEEYVKQVNEVKWNSRINGFDGIAGKREGDNILLGDGICDIYYRGKEFDVNKVSYSIAASDEYGFNTYVMNTKQLA